MKRLYILTFLLLLGLSLPATSAAQSEQRLPTDLLFVVDVGDKSYSFFHTLVRIDHNTLQVSPFYIDDTFSIRPLSWSPQGRFLAILRRSQAEQLEVCILDRDGHLQTCFEDTITMYAFQAVGENYTVTWSTDEQRVYFITEHDRILSLIEGDVSTGQTLRAIYQNPQAYGEVAPLIHWTPSLDFVAIYNINYLGVFDYANMIQVRKVTFIDLQTNKQLNLNTHAPQLGYLLLCEGFSPLGNYLTARVYTDERVHGHKVGEPALFALSLVDKGRQVVRILDQNQLGQYGIDWAYCPTWQAQEEAFYFVGGPLDKDDPTLVGKTSIFKYALSTGELLEHKHIGPEAGPGFPGGPLVLSPEGTAMAFIFRDASVMSEVAVLLPTGEIIRFNEPYSRGAYPVWIPSLGEPSQ